MIKIRRFVFNFVEVNTYLVYNESGDAVIIDCGCFDEKEENMLTSFINNNKLTVKHLLNTHLHFDHAFGNAFAAKTFGVSPEAHQSEETELPSLEEQTARFHMKLRQPSVPLVKHLNEEDTVTFGSSSLQCLLVPGHSPGSLAFYSREGNCVFTGDALFQGSIGRTDLWGGNFNTLISGIRSKLLTLPDETIIYPGHGPSSTIGEEKKHNMYLR